MVDVDFNKALYMLTKRKSCSTLSAPSSPLTTTTTGEEHDQTAAAATSGEPSGISGGGDSNLMSVKLRKGTSGLAKHRSSVSDAFFFTNPTVTATAARGTLSAFDPDVTVDYSCSSATGSQATAKAENDPKNSRRGSTVARWFRHIADAAEAYKAKESRLITGTNRKLPAGASLQRASQQWPSNLIDMPERNAVSTDSTPSTDRRSVASLECCRYAIDGRGQLDGSTGGDSLESFDAVEHGSDCNQHESRRYSPAANGNSTIENVHANESPARLRVAADTIAEKTTLINRTLYEKNRLLATILQIPHDDYHVIVEMVDEISEPKEIRELLLSTVRQADLLTQLINNQLSADNVSKSPLTSNDFDASKLGPLQITVPCSVILSIASRLHRSLTLLVEAISRMSRDNDRMRSEVDEVQSRLEIFDRQHRVFPTDHRQSELLQEGGTQTAAYTDSASTDAGRQQEVDLSPLSAYAVDRVPNSADNRPDADDEEADVSMVMRAMFIAVPLERMEVVNDVNMDTQQQDTVENSTDQETVESNPPFIDTATSSDDKSTSTDVINLLQIEEIDLTLKL